MLVEIMNHLSVLGNVYKTVMLSYGDNVYNCTDSVVVQAVASTTPSGLMNKNLTQDNYLRDT